MSLSNSEVSDGAVTPPKLVNIHFEDVFEVTSIATQESRGNTEERSTPSNSPIQSREILTNMSRDTTYEINGIRYTVQKKANTQNTETLYTKAKRKKYDIKERNELLEKVQKNQQTEFHSITLSVNDPERMTNTHSLSKMLGENKRNLTKYDLHDVYHIVQPKPGSFQPNHANYRLLELDSQNKPITFNLFSDYMRLTPEQVAHSSKWYSAFIPTDELMQENLLWSLAYYEKNVETNLYSKVHSQLLDYATDERGGPLFLKLLLDRVTTNNESNLKAIIHVTETYRVNKACKGENIETVVELFTALFNTMSSLRDGPLPENSLRNLLTIFQSTSVPEFNDLFRDMERELRKNQVTGAIDPRFALSAQRPGAKLLANDIESIHFTLKYAEQMYRTFVQEGTWDAILQQPAGQAAFIAQQQMGPTQFNGQQPQGHTSTTSNQTTGLLPVIPWTKAGDCFNCGQPSCSLRFCKHPRDPERISANKDKLPSYSKDKPKYVPKKWRKPEPHESNKRIIDGRPYTWNPTGGFSGTGRWDKDITPDDGQPNSGGTPQVHLLHSGRSEISSLTGPAVFHTSSTSGTNTTSSSSSSDPAERRLELSIKIAELEAERARLS